MLNNKERAIIEKQLLDLSIPFKMKDIQAVSGGCINRCYRIVSVDGLSLFIKVNELLSKDNFEKEKFNLEYLKNKSPLVVPEVVFLLSNAELNKVYLGLSYLERMPETDEFYFELGVGLAKLHQNSDKFFGWLEDNYIGSLFQKNERCGEWAEFFVTQRLEPLVKICFDKRMLDTTSVKAFNNLYNKIDEIFPKEPPALLHGDLWQGNRMPTTRGAAIFDAACYYGHREMDIAMGFLFGALPDVFFEGYNSVYSLEKDFMKRKDVCNLYPLLVHAVLFGMSYIYDIKSIIKKFQ